MSEASPKGEGQDARNNPSLSAITIRTGLSFDAIATNNDNHAP
jgi:hypothetical protein